MTFKNERLGDQLLGVANCPHCGVSAPVLVRVWQSKEMTPRADGRRPSHWACFMCTSCGSLVVAQGQPGNGNANPLVFAVYPELWEPDEAIPERASRYLKQAQKTMSSPDASVVMSASAVDSMLKDNGLSDGSLFKRINVAVEQGILTSGMAKWAHQVRIDSNNPRHADEQSPHMSVGDAKRALDFAKAISEILYVLPARMPEIPEDP